MNPYLDGLMAPVAEEVTVTDLAVQGQLPPELDGRFLRIGPDPVQPPADPANHHWFVGDGMVHGMRLGEGRAQWYRNRWVRTPAVAQALGEPPPIGPTPPLFDSSNTAFLALGGTAYSLTEMAYPYELSETLDTVGRTDFGGPLPNGFTAHPQVDPATGEVHAFGYGLVEPYMVYVLLSPEGRVVRTEPITMGGPASVHTGAITASRVLFLDLPVVFNMEAASGGSSFPFRWDSAYRARVGLMPKAGGDADVQWFDVDPCYVFHVANAFDVLGDDGQVAQVVADVIRYDTVFADSAQGPLEYESTFDRWTFDLASGKVQQERLDDRRQEFPRADPRRAGLPYRYAYAAEQSADSSGWGGMRRLIKNDLQLGTSELHDLGPARTSSEAVFVPAAGGGADDAAAEDPAAEDRGWLISFVYDAERGASELVVLDARDLTAPAVATVPLPVRVPMGFHGCWVPSV